MKALVLVIGVLTLAAFACSKPKSEAKVEVLEKTAYPIYLHSIWGDLLQQWRHTWKENCYGSVKNTGEQTALNVRVSAHFSRGHQAEDSVGQLAGGEVAAYCLYGDTFWVCQPYGYVLFDTANWKPRVSADVGVHWE